MCVKFAPVGFDTVKVSSFQLSLYQPIFFTAVT